MILNRISADSKCLFLLLIVFLDEVVTLFPAFLFNAPLVSFCIIGLVDRYFSARSPEEADSETMIDGQAIH